MHGPEHTLSRRRLLTLCVSGAGFAATSSLLGWKGQLLEGTGAEGAEAATAVLDPRVVAAARRQDWYRDIDANHTRLLEWLAVGHRNTGGISIAAPAVGSTFGKTDVPIAAAGPLDVDRQVAVIEGEMFTFLGDRPVIFSSDVPLSATELDSAKKLVLTWFPQVEAALGVRYPYAGTHVQLNVANASGRATTRGANIWLAPDFSNVAHAFVHERTHSFQYGPDQIIRFPIFATEGSAESIATILTATPALWHGDNVEVDAALMPTSEGAGAAYSEQSFNGYQLFADLLKLIGKGEFMSVIQEMHAGPEVRSGAEILALFRRAAPNPTAVDALYERSVLNYAQQHISGAIEA